MGESREAVVRVQEVSTRFEEHLVHDRVSFDVRRGEVFAIVGASGSGKSVLLREMTLLQRPTGGGIELFGRQTVGCPAEIAAGLRRRIGVLFQDGALFSSMTVLENIGFPLREHWPHLPDRLVDEIAMLKLRMTGLTPRAARRLPRQLSGGMRKRAALARAMALDPELLFLDEPSSGLDPISAEAFDELILGLQHSLSLTVVMVTHDMDSLWRVADRVVLLGESRVLALGTMEELARSGEPGAQRFFAGPRGRAARESAWSRA